MTARFGPFWEMSTGSGEVKEKPGATVTRKEPTGMFLEVSSNKAFNFH